MEYILMAQRRTERTILCLERTLNDVLQDSSRKEGMTPSEYVRKMLIEKFRGDGSLTEDAFNRMVL